MRGETLSSLARRHGFGDSYLRNVLIRPLYRGEQIIARFLGVPANQIWPARYHTDGTPKSRRARSSPRRVALIRRFTGARCPFPSDGRQPSDWC